MSKPQTHHLDELPPLRLLAEGFRDLPGLAVLEGGTSTTADGRWSYLAADPYDCVRWTSKGVRSDLHGDLPGDGFTVLNTLVGYNNGQPSGPSPPFAGGAIGYIAYDAAYELESIPAHCPNSSSGDLMWFGLYDWVVARDAHDGSGFIIATAAGGRDPAENSERILARMPNAKETITPPVRRHARTNVDQRVFGQWVEAIKDYIEAGDCYQVNIARRIEFDAPDPGFEYFQWLGARHPATFSAYVAAEGVEIVSASPELFVQVDAFGAARTRPIKGTAARGTTRALDRAAAERLQASAKDRAENLMIVDVLRNDFGRVCRPGSIHVPSLWQTEALPTVWQLVSEVRGTLRPEVTSTDLLRSCWPGGSITGAPKIRASEIIDELEPVRRGIYCGSVFALGQNGTLTANLAIRTVQLRGAMGYLHVGAGIVAESRPDLEYAETEDKARGVLMAMGLSEDSHV